ncbi:hypothetical protein NQZ79_g1157 [Umbelopsis isabellina]|nr:hypothetical protein NQZ79_g1157 [Umbelopsis isabellina]
MPETRNRKKAAAAKKQQQTASVDDPKTRAAKAAVATGGPSSAASRCAAALYSIITDCDEVFNYWEPTHWLQYGFGLQTWEYSPEFTIRSWSYISVHAVLGWIGSLFAKSKIQVFYFLRIMLGAISAFAEARFYRTVVEEINPHVGRYLLVALVGSAGMFQAAVAYLPSSFSMITTMMAFSFVLQPPTNFSRNRTYGATFFFGLGALLGWPFCAALGIPFVIEEVSIYGREMQVDEKGNVVKLPKPAKWRMKRAMRLGEAMLLSFVAISAPIVAIDYFFYGKAQFVPLNIVLYNVFSGSDKGPSIFGTEPWWFYIINGFLNFNIVFVMALGSAVCVLITMYVDRNRISNNATPGFSGVVSPYILLALKLVPFYIWFTIFTLQPHKEERFLYVAYPLICLNFAISLFLVRGWMHRATGLLGTSVTTRLYIVKYFTTSIMLGATIVSLSRVLALSKYYSAPKEVYTALWNRDPNARVLSFDYLNEDYRYDSTLGEKTLCVGKEWYRFPSSYFLPNDVRLGIVKSDFDGQLPKPFIEDLEEFQYDDASTGKVVSQKLRQYKFHGSSQIQPGFNDLNVEDPSVYVRHLFASDSLLKYVINQIFMPKVELSQCDFMVDSDFPMRYVNGGESSSTYEPRYIQDTKHWEAIACKPFLDAANSHRLSRAFWVPGAKRLQWGEYCLLAKK